MKRLGKIIIALQVSWIFTGCTAIQLRKQTPVQQRTTADIIQQQVMDNVAKIATNPTAWPQFCVVSTGSTQITDTGHGSLELTWDPRTLTQEALGLFAERNVQESFESKPVTEPARLRAMWTIYYYSIYGRLPPATFDYDPAAQMVALFGDNWATMIPPSGWFQISHGKDCCERVHCGCVVGHYCDTKACVVPGGDVALQELTYLTMHLSTVTYKSSAFPAGVKFLDDNTGPAPSGEEHAMAAPEMDRERVLPKAESKWQLGPAKEFIGPSYQIQPVPRR